MLSNSVDSIYDASEEAIEKLLLDKALMALLGATTGFWATILTPIIKLILEATAFQLARLIKRKALLQMDIIEGELTLNKVKEANNAKDESAYISAISNY